MQTKLFAGVLIFICCAAKSNAQNLLFDFKSKPVPFNYKIAPSNPQILKPSVPKNLIADTLRFSHQTQSGLVYITPQDGMQVLRPYSSATDYETKRTKIIKPYFVEPFGNPSIVEPMPNPLKKALIFEDRSK